MRPGRARLSTILALALVAWVVIEVGGAVYRVATSPELQESADRWRESAAEFDAEMLAIRRSGEQIRAEMVRINPEWSEIMGDERGR